MDKFLMSAVSAFLISTPAFAAEDIDYAELREQYSEWQFVNDGTDESGDFESYALLELDRLE